MKRVQFRILILADNIYNHQPPNFVWMDIEFIELEHRENVLKLMEICGIDMKEAYQLYVSSNYNFEAAVNRKFNPALDLPQQPIEPFPHHYQQSFIPPEEQDFGPGGYAGDPFFDEDLEMTQYRKFKQSGRTFEKQYPNRNNEGFFKSFFKFVKGNEQISFKKDLQKYLQRHTNLKVEHNNLSDAFHWCWKEKFPLAVILLDFAQNSQSLVRKLFSDEMLIEKVISEQFKAFGINTKTYQLQPELKPFFDLQRDANTIVLCRVNHLDNIQIVKRIRIHESLQDIRKKIKQAKSECIQNQLDQSHIVRQFQEEMRGNFNYSRPKTIKESIKMREDKKLRRQQEEEYFKACQTKKQPTQERPPEKKLEQKPYSQPQPKLQPSKQQKQVSSPSISVEKVNQLRGERLSRLKKYNAGIMFKIRVPEGNNLIVQVDGDEIVQYLFDFVENQPEELGFSNQLDRKFDLCVGFGSGETLKGKEKLKLKQLFQGSQVLIVREI